MMLAGVGLISTLAASITAYLVGQESNYELTELRDSLAQFETRIDSLIASMESDRPMVNRHV